MSKIEVDTNKLRNLSQDFMSQTEKIEEKIDEFFLLIESIKEQTHEWQGDVADRYVLYIMSNKGKYTDFISTLKTFSKKLASCAEQLSNCKKKCEYEGVK